MRSLRNTRTRVGIAAAGLVALACAGGLATMPASASTTTHQQAASSAISCGSWRWPVKTGSDANRSQVRKAVSYTSVGYLDHRTPPHFTAYAQDHRIAWPEYRTWQINKVTLVAIKLEDDGDLHLRLRSSTGALMIAEIPQPSCVSSHSLWKTGITAARHYVTGRYWVSLSKWHYIHRSINIQGLGFFDEEHGVTGAAPNDIELHPVTYIHVN